MKILLGNFNAKVGREDIFKPTTANESLYESNNDNGIQYKINDNGVILVNFATSKNFAIMIEGAKIIFFKIQIQAHSIINRC
jgi:hypothetical protein